jgi:hypothetical protein
MIHCSRFFFVTVRFFCLFYHVLVSPMFLSLWRWLVRCLSLLSTWEVLVIGYRYGVVSYKPSHARRPFYVLLRVPISVPIIPDSPTSSLWKVPAETPSSGAGRNGEKCPSILPANYLCHTAWGSLTCRKILRNGADGFTSCYGFLSPLKIHCPRPDLNLRTLGSMESTITTRPPRTKTWDVSRVGISSFKLPMMWELYWKLQAYFWVCWFAEVYEVSRSIPYWEKENMFAVGDNLWKNT